MFKSGFVTISGRPNVGKSTLLNALTGEKLAITSAKPQTTRNTIRAVMTDNTSQIVFLDTPGIHRPKTKLGEYMVSAANDATADVDAVLFIVDASSDNLSKADKDIVEMLERRKTNVFLVLNKIDLIPKDRIFKMIDEYTKLMDFKAIIPVSALECDGIEILKKELIKSLPEGPKYYPDDIITDQPEKVVAAEMIREKLLTYLSDEVPHGVGVEIISFKERTNKKMTDIEANIFCEKQSHKAIIIGKQGAMLKRIGQSARKDIEKMLDSPVNLQLWIKVKPDWRNNNTMLKTLGYKKHDN